MSSQTILREYLLSLGFKVDQTGQRRFDSAIAGTAKSAGLAGLAVGGLAATIATLAERYALAMEKMYYASRKGGGTVGQLQAMEFAGQQVGLAAGTMTSAVTTMASKLRMNQGLLGLLSQLGVETKGRTPVQEMMDLIDKTASMEYQKGASIASLFGLDEGTYQVMRQNRAEMRAAMEEQEKLNKSMGVDIDANAKAMAEWGKQVGEVKAAFQVLQGSLATALLPMMRDLAAITKGWLGDVAKAVNGSAGKSTADRLEDVGVALAGNPAKPNSGPWNSRIVQSKDNGFLNQGAKDKLQDWHYKILSALTPAGYAEKHGIFPSGSGGGGAGRGSVNPSAGAGGEGTGNGFGSQAERYAALEKMWGLTPGTLQSLRNLESNDGKNMGTGRRNANDLGGIVGDFQMNSANQKHYGVNDTSDEADAAAEMFSDLKKIYKTDAATAAAWNGGTNAGLYGPSHGVNPAETEAFVPKFMSGLQQTNNITVNGGGPGVVGAVKQGLAQANGDLVRNMKTVVR